MNLIPLNTPSLNKVFYLQAEEITLTIGQAFDLAYRRFLDTTGREGDLRKQLLALQKRTNDLEEENLTLKTRITQLAALKNRPDVESFMKENNVCIKKSKIN